MSNLIFTNLSEYSNKRVFHFSGGHSSALMVLQNYRAGDLVIFCDTGREDPDTYRFINDFQKHNGIPVIWLTGNWQKEVIEKDQVIPNMFKRKCTLNLKIKKARRYLRSIGWFHYTQFIGFRKDEKNRVNDYKTWQSVETVFPLYNAGIDKPQVNLFWQPISYRLTIPEILSNCDLCFLKGKDAVIAIIQNDPTKADKWIADEENRTINPKGHTYFSRVTIRQLRDIAISLPIRYDLTNFNYKTICACTA